MDRRAMMLGAVASGLALPQAMHAKQADKPGDPRIAALVDQVSAERLRADVVALANFSTRWTLSPDFPQVEAWVEAALLSAGAPPEALRRVAHHLPSGAPRHSLISGATDDPRGLVLVGAHFDSTSQTPAQRAPGANDNATGVAAMLEALRILGPVPLGRSLVCAAFAGEEQDAAGSTACAAVARAEAWSIAMMLNLDMLGHHPADPSAPMVIEYDQGNAQRDNDDAARRLGRLAAGLAVDHTSLAVSHTDIWASDYMPFEAQGFPCIGLYDDGYEAPEYHSTSDLPEAVDFDRLVQATRLTVAILATVAGLPG